MQNHSYENVFRFQEGSFSCKLNSYACERLYTMARFGLRLRFTEKMAHSASYSAGTHIEFEDCCRLKHGL